jgi:topoisomerase-4 subunit B
MDPEKRILLRVTVAEHEDPDPRAEQKRSADTVERLMGRKPELRFRFIQENARFVEAEELDV